MDIATIKKDLENQIGDINKELKNIYLPLEAVLILLGKRTAFQIALGLIDSLQQEQPQVADASKMEQPVDGLEEEIIRYLRDEYSSDDEPLVSEIARHFYELGLNARKEK